MECKHGFKYVQNQTRFVYQNTKYLSYIIDAPSFKNDPSLAPLHKSAEFRIVSVFENTQKAGCSNPGRVVALANMLPKVGAYY
jgi:hypothetical protein